MYPCDKREIRTKILWRKKTKRKQRERVKEKKSFNRERGTSSWFQPRVSRGPRLNTRKSNFLYWRTLVVRGCSYWHFCLFATNLFADRNQHAIFKKFFFHMHLFSTLMWPLFRHFFFFFLCSMQLIWM